MGNTKKSAAKPVEVEEIADTIEQIQAEAKEKFSLRDRLTGISSRTAKVLIITDHAAASRRQAKLAERDTLEGEVRLWNTQEQNEATVALLEDATARLAVAEAELEEANQEMLKTALSIHMRALPQISIKYHERQTRKKFAGKNGKVDPEKQDRLQDATTNVLLEASITGIFDAQGNQGEVDVDFLAAELSAPDWSRLVTTLNRLNFEDVVGKAATDDPGF